MVHGLNKYYGYCCQEISNCIVYQTCTLKYLSRFERSSNMDEQDPLVFGDTVSNRLFGLPEVLDKNVDDIIVNECNTVLTKPPDR